MTTLFISDLHLTGERENITTLFIDFLEKRAANADALYILGDLFEVWMGDDMILPDYMPCINMMKKLVGNGVPVYIMHGNRDFLMAEKFSELSGATLIDDPTVIDLYGTPTLLMHGDTLCTDDIDYQKFRAMVRDPHWQKDFLDKTTDERLAMAAKLREVSKEAMSNKTMDIMDVNQHAVEEAMSAQGIFQLIHGHTHRPAIHDFVINKQNMKRIVLGDWYDQGSVLSCNNKGCELESL